ncbi:hypothetical protein PLON_TP00105 [Candidatus Tremblaya princeps]|uniref:Uncharacterized protein n=1 Tax=Tremblaya princeps TaxID=189385 RepID=A0A143WN89_TREPR|nr:hypothetical protein PLON_TP00105 [Candidatus Tremblaya princeps]
MSSARCSPNACARLTGRIPQPGLWGSVAVSRVHVGKLLANGKQLVSLESDNKTLDVPCCLARDGCSVAEVYVLAEVASLPASWRAAFLPHCWSSALPLPAGNAALSAHARKIARAARSPRSAPLRHATASMLRARAASGTVVRPDRAAGTAYIGWRSSCVNCSCTAAQCAGPRAARRDDQALAQRDAPEHGYRLPLSMRPWLVALCSGLAVSEYIDACALRIWWAELRGTPMGARLAPGSNGLGWRAVITARLCTQPGYEHISAWVGAPVLYALVQHATVLVYACTGRIVGCGVVGSWAELLTSSVALGAELASMLCSPAHWRWLAGAVQ